MKDDERHRAKESEKKLKIKLTEIVITPLSQATAKGIVAFCNFIINNSFKVCDCAIATNRTSGGMRLIYPIKQLPSRKGETITAQIFYPINKEVADQISKQVLKEFDKLQNLKAEGYKE